MVPAEYLRERSPVVVTGYAALTPLGTAEETFKGLLEGKSGVRHHDTGNRDIRIGAPVEFDPHVLHDRFDRKDLRGNASITLMTLAIALQAAASAGLLASDGRT